MRSAFFLIMAVLFGVLPTVSSAQESPLEMLLRNFSSRQDRSVIENPAPGPRIIQIRPKREKRRVAIRRPPNVDAAAAVQTPDTQPDTPGGPQLSIVVLGDVMGEQIADGLSRDLQDRPDIAVIRRTKAASGLVRDDYFDWNKSITDLLAGTDKVDAVVMMIGSNDRQSLRDEKGVYDPQEDEWRAIYAKRIDDALAQFTAARVPVFWIGLPPMRSDAYSSDVVYFNDIFRERVERSGATYVDIWDAFVDENGRYTPSGPGLNGQPTRLRASDGINFTKAGALLAAHFARRDLARIIGDAPQLAGLPRSNVASPVNFDQATPSPVSGFTFYAPTLGEFGQLPLNPAAEFVAPKPAYGPIMPLEAEERSPGGVLIGTLPDDAATAADPSVATVLVRGDALPAKPGRGDDFRWPRPMLLPQRTSEGPVAEAKPLIR